MTPGLDHTFWRGKRVLLTGHTGFKGAWATLWLHRLGAHVTGLALPPEPLSLFRLLRLDKRVESHFVDLRDADAVAAAVTASRPQLVLHMAAQPLVSRGLAEPAETFAINTQGTVHLLDALRTLDSLSAVLVVTTDKVYANDETGHPCRETDRLGGKDPYAASKAACEIVTAGMAAAFLQPRGIAVGTARGGNVIGGGDFAADRLVPDAARAAQADQALVLRDPFATRPWQYVLDCLCGYFAYLSALAAGRSLPASLNFGPSHSRSVTVGELASAMLEALGAASPWSHQPAGALREAHALALDSSLARRTLGWTDRIDGPRMVAETACWYRAWANHQDVREISTRQLEEYEALP